MARVTTLPGEACKLPVKLLAHLVHFSKNIALHLLIGGIGNQSAVSESRGGQPFTGSQDIG